jgi:hypothetical protein
MHKIGIVGHVKSIDKMVKVVENAHKCSPITTYLPQAQSWEDAYMDSGFDAFLHQVDGVVFCKNLPQCSPLIEKALYRLKHVFLEQIVVEATERIKDWCNLSEEAGVVFHIGNTLSVNPSFLSIWPYLRGCVWMEINMEMPFKSRKEFESFLMAAMDVSNKTLSGRVDKIHQTGSSMFGLDFPEYFSLWMESTGGTVIRINLSYNRHETLITGKFNTSNRHFEVDFLTHKVWELKKKSDNSFNGVLFNSENDVELQQILPEIGKIPRHVIYFDSLSKELMNFSDNIHNRLTPLTGIHDLLDVSALCDKIFTKHRFQKVV